MMRISVKLDGGSVLDQKDFLMHVQFASPNFMDQMDLGSGNRAFNYSHYTFSESSEV
jgi:hypothetical protein